MTAPRQILPGQTVFISRRCFLRSFYLVPDEVVNQVFLYVLSVAAERYDVLIHTATVMSNHWHCVVTDTLGNLPRFTHFVHAMVARAINAHRGRWDGFWSPSSYSAVRLVTTEDAIEKIFYTLLNPVTAGLVAHSCEWPGLMLNPMEQCEYTVERPKHFFRSTNKKLPDVVTLRLAPLPGASHKLYREMKPVLAERTAAIRARFIREGRQFMGPTRVLRQKWYKQARTAERRRGRNPHIACHDSAQRVAAIRQRQQFLEDHRQAREAWISGHTRAVFPRGTYQMRVIYGVRCLAQGP